MVEIIQFNCPACNTMLRLPLAMTAQQGPCPHCGREIVSPDAYQGIAAHEKAGPPGQQEIKLLQLFEEATANDDDVPGAVEPAPVSANPQRATLILSCLVSAAAALALGFALGIRKNEMTS